MRVKAAGCSRFGRKKRSYNADPGKVVTTQIGRKTFRRKSGRDYFDLDSSVTSVEQFAATMAGAMTIPIKARAIKKSCMIYVPNRRSAELGNRPAKAPLARSPTSGRGNTATRESKAQTRAVPQFTCPFRCLAGCLFLMKKPLGVCGPGYCNCGPAEMPTNRFATDLPLHHRRDERNLEIPRKAGRIRGSGRARNPLESYEGRGKPQPGAKFTMLGDGAHSVV